MRFLAFILAVVVLAQSWMPCADDLPDAIAGMQRTSLTASSGHPEPTGHTDACSPFCRCACCSGFSINHSIAAVPAVFPARPQHLTAYLSARINRVSLPVWQPPQLTA